MQGERPTIASGDTDTTLPSVSAVTPGNYREEALVLTIASLTTTGPLTEIAGNQPIELGQVSEAARLIFAGAMVVGRLETLAIIALLNPDFWRS